MYRNDLAALTLDRRGNRRRNGDGVTVVVPTFNRAHLLRQTLESLVAQSKPCRIVVCDDASRDRTKMVCEAFAPHVEYVRNDSRVGLFANWNKCLSLVETELVALYHDDDLYHPEIVFLESELLTQHPDAVMVHTACTFIDDRGRTVGVSNTTWPSLSDGQRFRDRIAGRFASPVAAPSVMLRTAAIRSIGGFDETLRMSGDLTAWVAVAKLGPVGFLPSRLVAIRRRGRYANAHARFSWSIVGEMVAVGRATQAEVRGRVTSLLKLKTDLYLAQFLLREIAAPSGEDPIPVVREHGSAALVMAARTIPYLRWLRPVAQPIRPLVRLIALGPQRIGGMLQWARALVSDGQPAARDW